MEIQTKRLKPGMVLLKSVLGKSGKPLIEEKTELTEKHIDFLNKFMINNVMIAPLPGHSPNNPVYNKAGKENKFDDQYECIVRYYQSVLMNIKNHVGLDNLYEVRKHFIPFFEYVQELPFSSFLNLLTGKQKPDSLSYKSVAMSALAVYIASRIHYEKKDWLQIGFAALFADAGFMRMSKEVQKEPDSERPSDIFRMHPFHSYKTIEDITTLTKQAKVAVLQHQERLDGSGYPAKISEDKVTLYARIIAVCDYFFLIDDSPLSQKIYLLEEKKGVKLDQQATEFLIEELKSVLNKCSAYYSLINFNKEEIRWRNLLKKV